MSPPAGAGPKPPRGRFVTFEGGEGAGKSTQVAVLEDALKRAGIEVLVTREPGGTLGADLIRQAVLSGAASRFGPQVETLLFAAARAEHVDAVIAPALAAGRWVLCDRFLDSTRVYQGGAGVEPGLLRALEAVTVAATVPDLTIILDLPAAVGLERAAARRGAGEADRFEAETMSVHEARRRRFLAIAAEEPARCVVVDAEPRPSIVAAAIRRLVGERFGLALGERLGA